MPSSPPTHKKIKDFKTMSEFERTKQEIGNRKIMLTSWFDEHRQSWRASAPGYAHLSVVVETGRVACDSRQAAVNLLCDVLTHYFATPAH